MGLRNSRAGTLAGELRRRIHRICVHCHGFPVHGFSAFRAADFVIAGEPDADDGVVGAKPVPLRARLRAKFAAVVFERFTLLGQNIMNRGMDRGFGS